MRDAELIGAPLRFSSERPTRRGRDGLPGRGASGDPVRFARLTEMLMATFAGTGDEWCCAFSA